MKNQIGIDFGTTKTLVSYLNPTTNQVELIRLGRDRDSIPTTVHVDEAGEFLFGEDADDQIETDPEGYVRAFKLELGNNDPIARGDLTAEALTTRFLAFIRSESENMVFHAPIQSATITVPVAFSPARKASLKRAALAAGFSSVSFLPEPEAAGIAFLRDNPDKTFSRALILDWGGGTLDISIVERKADGSILADTHCGEGRDDVGGEEMDRGLLENLSEFWNVNFGEPLVQQEMDEVRFLRSAQKIKEQLSKKSVATFRRGPQKQDISQEQFREIISQLLGAASDLVSAALGKNRSLGAPDPDVLILIGGTSQIPLVRETMANSFPNLKILSWHHSHEAVALGAIECLLTPRTNRTDRENTSPKSHKPKRKNIATEPSATESPCPLNSSIQNDGQRGNMERLGDAFLYGMGDDSLYEATGSYDPILAARYYEEGIRQKEWACYLGLSACYSSGLGKPFDPEEATRMELEAARLGSSVAVANLWMNNRTSTGELFSTQEAKLSQFESLSSLLDVPNPVDTKEDRELQKFAIKLTWMTESDDVDIMEIQQCLDELTPFQKGHYFVTELGAKAYRSIFELALITKLSPTACKKRFVAWLSFTEQLASQISFFRPVLCHLLASAYESGKEEIGIPADGERALYFWKLAAEMNDPDGRLQTALAELSGNKLIKEVNKIQNICRHGPSLLLRDNELPVKMSLVAPEVDFILVALPDSEENFVGFRVPPSILFTKTGKLTSNNFVLSVEDDSEYNSLWGGISLKNNTAVVNPCLDLGWPAALFDEISSDRIIKLAPVHASFERTYFRCTERLAMGYFGTIPIMVYWTSGTFSGYVLHIVNMLDSDINVSVKKVSIYNLHPDGTSATATCAIEAHGSADFGWLEFSDSSNPIMGEIFFISIDETHSGFVKLSPDATTAQADLDELLKAFNLNYFVDDDFFEDT